MIEIPLASVANQTLSIQLNQIQYDLSIYTANNIMAMDIIRDNEIILEAQRLVSGFPVIPYPALENGNFIFVTANEEYPDYLQFGVSQYLLYATNEELEAIIATA